MSDWQILIEPVGDQYAQLLEALTVRCNEVGFHLDLPLEPSGLRLLEQLHPYLLRQEVTTETPGSTALSPLIVQHYRLDEHTAEVIIRAAGGLYDWQEPNLPNDLFLSHDGRPVLVTLASDGESYLILSGAQRDQLTIALPWLELKPFGDP